MLFLIQLIKLFTVKLQLQSWFLNLLIWLYSS